VKRPRPARRGHRTWTKEAAAGTPAAARDFAASMACAAAALEAFETHVARAEAALAGLGSAPPAGSSPDT